MKLRRSLGVDPERLVLLVFKAQNILCSNSVLELIWLGSRIRVILAIEISQAIRTVIIVIYSEGLSRRLGISKPVSVVPATPRNWVHQRQGPKMGTLNAQRRKIK